MAQQNSASAQTPTKRRFFKSWIFATILIITVVVVAYEIGTFVGKPKPEVTSVIGGAGFEGGTRVFFVIVGVRYGLGGGLVTVYAQINAYGVVFQQQHQTVDTRGWAITTVDFTFDISSLSVMTNPSITYSAWVTAA